MNIKVFSKYYFISVFVFLLMLMLTSCSHSEGDGQEPPKMEQMADADSITLVKTFLAEYSELDNVIELSGKIKSKREMTVMADNNAKVAFCRVTPGAVFEKGQVMVRFETTSLDFRMKRARLSQFNSSKEYESQLLGYQNLLKKGDTSQANTIRKKLRISSGLANAEQEIQETSYELSKSVLIAPFRCKAADVKIAEGDYSRFGQEIFKIYDPSQLILEVKVLESDFVLLNKSILATVSPVSNTEIIYKGSVYNVNPYIDENGLATVFLKVDGSEKLVPGMSCTASLRIPSVKSVIIPKEAVVTRKGKTIVFTIEHGVARWNYVKVGKDNGRLIQVLEGISVKDEVITSNNLHLNDNSPVKSIVNMNANR